MTSCWHPDSNDRPQFSALCNLLQLEEIQKAPSKSEINQERYVHLTSMNSQRNNESIHNDGYLQLVAPSASETTATQSKGSAQSCESRKSETKAVTNPSTVI